MSAGKLVKPWIGAKLSSVTCDNEKTAHPGSHATDGLPYTYWEIDTAATAVFTLTLDEVQTVDRLFLEAANLGAGNLTVVMDDAGATEQFNDTFAIATYLDDAGNIDIPITSTPSIKEIEVTITGQSTGATIRHMVPGLSFTPDRNFWWDPEFSYINNTARDWTIGGVRHGVAHTTKKSQQLNWEDMSAANAWAAQQIIETYGKDQPILIIAYPGESDGVYASRNFLAEMADFIGPRHTRGDYFDLSITFVQV